jgi:metallopeptidase MepB
MEKYKNPPQPPPLFTGTKESIVSDSKALCDKTRTLLDRLVADINPSDASKATFDAVMLPQLYDENNGGLSAKILSFYQYVSGDSALRDASTEAEKLMDEFGIECSMREDVFKLVDAVYRNSGLKDAKGETDVEKAVGLPFDAESARLLERERKNYIKNGLGIPAGPLRDRFKDIKKRLSQIQITFSKNLNEENGGLWFTKEELDGVPEDVVDNLEKGVGENEGKLRLTFKYPDLFPTLKFAKNPGTRRRLFVENENKVKPISRLCLWVSWLIRGTSATKTCRCLGRQLCSEMRLPVFSVTRTTPLSG